MTTEVALSVILLAGTVLMLRTAINLQRMDLGFDPEGVLAINATQLGPIEGRIDFETQAIERVSALPGVESAAAVFPAPMNGVYQRYGSWAKAASVQDPDGWNRAYLRTATPGYFSTMRLEMVQGRDFNEFDLRDEPKAAIIDESLARTHWPTESPIGERFAMTHLWRDSLEFEVVGVVENAPQWDHRDTEPTIYVSRGFFPTSEVTFVVRSDRATSRPADAIRRILGELRPEVPVDSYPLLRNMSDVLASTHFVVTLLGIFAGIAVLLAGVGLYGVLAYGVRQRTREIGVRMAFGAEANEVMRSIVLESVKLTGVGIGFGVAGALLLGRVLESQLFEVATTDLVSIASTAIALLAVAGVASLLPSRRAARVDPLVALRAD